jgi:hypothetical protein
MLSAMEYRDWMMVAGAALLVLGFIGLHLAKTGRLSPIMSRRNAGATHIGEKPDRI